MSERSQAPGRRVHAKSSGKNLASTLATALAESLAKALAGTLPKAGTARPTCTRATGALLCLALLFADGAAALPEDRLQAIAITAERAERHERGGYTIYSGAVVLQQGSLHIEADRLTIFHDREAADRIVAVGAPARMRQQPAIDKGPVRASAMRIVYEKSRELVTLRDTASIEQDGAVVTGESIEYFMAEQLVRADSASTDKNARVQVFIPADVIAEEADDGSAAAVGGDAPAAGADPDAAPKNAASTPVRSRDAASATETSEAGGVPAGDDAPAEEMGREDNGDARSP